MSKPVLIGIYKITSPTNKVYIGRSTNILNRFKGYKVTQSKKQTKLYNSFNKYGVSAHKFEILELCSINKLSEKETFYIQKYSSYNTEHGLNLTGGGDGAYFLSVEARKKIGDFHRGHKYNLGRVMSEETKQKLRELGRVRVFTQQHKERLGNALRGRKHSQSAIEKIKAARSLQISPMKGRKHTEETKLKISRTKLSHSEVEQILNQYKK